MFLDPWFKKALIFGTLFDFLIEASLWRHP